ncbi:MAG: nucleoside-triphosphatase [Peptococcaceae bacterium]|nr:nucleoside-triphosphatase [Peptococcaceae bacterium]
MHIFLQGQRNVGRSTVIIRTLDIIRSKTELIIGGFITFRGGTDDPYTYMRSANPEGKREDYCLGSCHKELRNEPLLFDQVGVPLLKDSQNADIIVMDELGFLEREALEFHQAVYSVLAGDIPVIGVLRLGNILWFEQIKTNPKVKLVEVTKENRDGLPEVLASRLMPILVQRPTLL